MKALKFINREWHDEDCVGNTGCSCNYEANKRAVEIVYNNKALGMIPEKELDKLEKEASQPTIQDQLAQLEKEVEALEEKLYQVKIQLVNLN